MFFLSSFLPSRYVLFMIVEMKMLLSFSCQLRVSICRFRKRGITQDFKLDQVPWQQNRKWMSFFSWNIWLLLDLTNIDNVPQCKHLNYSGIFLLLLIASFDKLAISYTHLELMLCAQFIMAVNWLNGKVIRRDFSCISYYMDIAYQISVHFECRFKSSLLFCRQIVVAFAVCMCGLLFHQRLLIRTEHIRSYCKSSWNSFVHWIPFHSSQFFQQAWMIHVFHFNFLSFPPLEYAFLDGTLHINMHKNRTKLHWNKHTIWRFNNDSNIHTKFTKKITHTVRWPSHIIWLLYYIFPCDNRLWIYHCENKNMSRHTHNVYNTFVLRLWI